MRIIVGIATLLLVATSVTTVAAQTAAPNSPKTDAADKKQTPELKTPKPDSNKPDSNKPDSNKPELPKVSTKFTLLVWNVAKQATVREELATYAETCDIVCLQEYVPGIVDKDAGHTEFARSYQSWFSGIATGVCTVSKHPHAGADALRSPWREGFVLTPKMTLVSIHKLGEHQLMVVNLHGMNFEPYLTFMLRQQLQQIAKRVQQHMGPVVVCGDFNTWSQRRQELVEDSLDDCRRVEFPKHPQRKTGEWIVSYVGGDPTLPLDHVYTRGIQVVAKPKILPTKHSDHAPLKVTLQVTGEK
jgi:endonuclease/exonuclease/phosphatase (EEP) superfamily protein YafD